MRGAATDSTPGSAPGTAALAALCALAVLAYLPGLAGPYQFDDYLVVARDPGAASLAAWWENLATHVRPILKASFAITASLGAHVGDAATGHRVANLAIHLAATLAFFALGVRAQRALEPWRENADARWRAFVAAAIFALHPLATEGVSYVSGRSASLATLGAVLALLAWMSARDSRGGARAAWLASGTAAWAVACGSREVAVLAPLAWLLVEGLRPDRDAAARRRLLAGLALAAAACAAFVAWLLLHPRYGALLALSGRILEARAHEAAFATALGHLGCVAALACPPSIDPAPAAVGWPGATLVAGALALAAFAAIRARRRHPMALVAFAWAALWLLPVYALPIRQDVVSERHAYPAVWSLGWLVAAAVVPLAAAPERRLRLAGHALGALLLAALAALAAQRNAEYRSEEALWEAAVRVPAPKARALNNLGAAHLAAGHWEEARRALEAAARLDPGHETIAINLDRARRGSRD